MGGHVRKFVEFYRGLNCSRNVLRNARGVFVKFKKWPTPSLSRPNPPVKNIQDFNMMQQFLDELVALNVLKRVPHAPKR